jgi:hypothetical protein
MLRHMASQSWPLTLESLLMSDVTLQLCPVCDGQGRIYHPGHQTFESPSGNLIWDDWSEPCEECVGTGGALVPCVLIELEDLGLMA